MSSVPGRAGVGFGCCLQEGIRGAFPGVFPEKVFLCAPLVVVSLSPTSTPGGSRGPQGGLVGQTGSTARCPWGPGCWPVLCRCPFGGGGRWGRGGAVGVGLLSLVFRVPVCGGRGGYGAWWHGVVGCKRQDYPTASTRIKNCTIPSLVTQIVIPFVRVMSYLHKNDINNKTHTNMYKYT